MNELITEDAVMAALETVYDPEIRSVSIVELGLIYSVNLLEENRVEVVMTLTKRGCPLVKKISEMAKNAVMEIPGVEDVSIKVVWDPVWIPAMMSESARKRLGFQ